MADKNPDTFEKTDKNRYLWLISLLTPSVSLVSAIGLLLTGNLVWTVYTFTGAEEYSVQFYPDRENKLFIMYHSKLTNPKVRLLAHSVRPSFSTLSSVNQSVIIIPPE